MALTIILTGFQFTGEHPIARQLVVWVANIAMILTVVLFLRKRGKTLADLGLSRIHTSWKSVLKLLGASLLAFLFAITAFVVASVIMANISGIPERADMSSYNFLAGNLPMLLLALTGVFVASSFGEELVYRGFLMTHIAETMGTNKHAWTWAIVISSMVFGLVHYDWGLMGIVQTTFMGAALAISWLKARKNLWVVIIAHAYMDFILMLQMYLG